MKKLYTHRSIYLLFAVCWVCYFCTYLGRLNFTACIAEINTAEHISKLKLGQISSAFFVCYGFGQLFSGFLADRLCAKRLVGLGLLGSAILNWGMALCHTPDMMVLIWALNGLFQSMAWAPLVRTVADLVPGPQCARICLNLATTTPVGTLAAYGICVICISLGNWQRAFWTGGLFLTVAGVLWLAAITALERLAHRDGIEDVLAQGNVRSTLPEKKSTQQLVLTLAPVLPAGEIQSAHRFFSFAHDAAAAREPQWGIHRQRRECAPLSERSIHSMPFLWGMRGRLAPVAVLGQRKSWDYIRSVAVQHHLLDECKHDATQSVAVAL